MSTWQQTPVASSPRVPRLLFPFLLVIVALVLLRGSAAYILEYEWWKEIGQIETWSAMILYSFTPVVIGTVLLFVLFWVAHARALKTAGTGLGQHPAYARVTTLFLLFIAWVVAGSALDSWTAVRFFGAMRVADQGWRDPVFGNSLRFYIFELPFYRSLITYLLIGSVAALAINIVGSVVWTARRFDLRKGDVPNPLDLALEVFSTFARTMLVVVLVAIALKLFLGRYGLLFSDHSFLVGVDYTDEKIRLPLQWLAIAAVLAAIPIVVLQRYRWLAIIAIVFVLRALLPGIVNTVYVHPNELALQKPYIERHIAATRSAYRLDKKITEVQYPARVDAPVVPARNQALFENVRLWDWRAFHDTITQLQALRQYYVFPDTDVDRYRIGGVMRQVLVAPREIDVKQLGGDRASWINQHLIYTHGYGLVMAPASRITPEGQPVLLVQDAPPKINTPDVQLKRPELYFGETLHEPVFVRTAQAEFNYPTGTQNVHINYDGRAGLPATLLTRLAAAFTYGDWNVLLTQYLSGDSRMIIHRQVRERLGEIANFVHWDRDPYLVVTPEGRLVWMVDGYTASSSHPYARRLNIGDAGQANYIRNSVKATIDAYDGTTTLYVFDNEDIIIKAWRALFPKLFKDASEMPATLQAHIRYPETLFRVQAEAYRAFHIQDPEAFYNKEDLWDVARENRAQGETGNFIQPAYVMATLPGESQAEFLLILPFTPRGKDNMIGLMAARSDPAHFGELVLLQLSRQALIYGPLQVEARIDSDQNISKDLTLWNQQGSQVIRGDLLTLPVEGTFLYVEPIYIQSAQARMPQLKKVVLAVGNRIVYRDTYEQAIAELDSGAPVQSSTATPAGVAPAPLAPSPPPQPGTKAVITEGSADPRLQTARQHLRRYRELASQGRFAEAGRELEALENELK